MTDNASRGCWVFFVDILWVNDRRRRVCLTKPLTFILKTGLSPRMRVVEDFCDRRRKNGTTPRSGFRAGLLRLKQEFHQCFLRMQTIFRLLPYDGIGSVH